ncbi:MAG: hypothetical protein HQL32_00555 [Planctomycetes bacterium]|nr:hypothetical protein [Planctomycetota bacterium]
MNKKYIITLISFSLLLLYLFANDDYSKHNHSILNNYSWNSHKTLEWDMGKAEESSCSHDHAQGEGHSEHNHSIHSGVTNKTEKSSCGHDHAQDDDHSGHNHEAPSAAIKKPEDSSCDHDHESHSETEVSEQALANMGVKIQAINTSHYTLYTPVPAVVAEHNNNIQPLFSPTHGRILSINVIPGEFIQSKTVLLRMLRAPIKRPEINMVDNILKPASEEYHNTVIDYRKNNVLLKIINQELSRIKTFQDKQTSTVIVPRKEIIELNYRKAEIEADLKNNEQKMQWHGLSLKDINKVSSENLNIPSANLWLGALKANQIWNKQCERLLMSLPKEDGADRWCIATIGEMSAEELISPALIEWLESNKEASAHFLKIARLLQDGHSLQDIKDHFQSGSLEAIVSVMAPLNETGWDIDSVNVKVGQWISEGDSLLTLSNHSDMYLLAHPQGSEIIPLTKSCRENLPIQAVPLLPGTGLNIPSLSVSKMSSNSDGQDEVYLPFINTIMSLNKSDTGKTFRNWNLRSGMKYFLQVPINILKDVIVLPSKAVIQVGPDKIVYIKAHNQFIKRKVIVLHEDSDYAVIGEGSELLPGEAMVTEGAFALHQALIAGTPMAVDPHAGHNH